MSGNGADVKRERDLLLDILRSSRPFGKRYHLGLSSMSLLLSAIGGDPIRDRPWDEGDLEGLTDTFENLPVWLKERAEPVYREQVARYRAYRESVERDEARAAR